MKALKILGVVLTVLFVAAGAIAAQSAFRFDLAVNKVAAPIRGGSGVWGEFVELTPEPFMLGQKRQDVEDKLRHAGFSRTPDDQVWKRYENEILAGRQLFEREANDLVCNIKLYVFVEFDGGGTLVSARGAQHEHGCM